MRLHDYLHRVNVTEPLDASVATLRRLHRAHRETFLFENLSIQAGGGVSVAIEDIERKFLDDGRGGYCFEQNTLFAAALHDAGFTPVTLVGRVRQGPPERWARTHMVLAVPLERSEIWLADVGFGAIGLVEPIPLLDGTASTQAGLTYTLRREPHVWVLSMQDASGKAMDLYEFSEDPQTAGDVVVANHYTSTHPDSVFRRSLTIQSTRGDERTILRTHVLTRYRAGQMTEARVDRAHLEALARELFGVELPRAPMVFDSYATVAV